MTKSRQWSLATVWNTALESAPERTYEPRLHMWASELGGSYYDRYFKMKGRKPTTPPNLRAQRKFEAGNLIEWVVAQVLARAGALVESQTHIVSEVEGQVKITGRLDFFAGGDIRTDYDFSDLPPTIAELAKRSIELLRKRFPGGLTKRGLEIKSCSLVMFEQYLHAPSIHHILQAYHYASNTGEPYTIVYICRDDLRMTEWTIQPNDRKAKIMYDFDRAKMTELLKLKPAQAKKLLKEPLLVYEKGKWKKNYKVEYSSYLTDYKYKEPTDYSEPAGKIATRLNNLCKRLKEFKKLTALNEKTMHDAIAFFPPVQPHLVKLINEWHVNYEPPVKVKKGAKNGATGQKAKAGAAD